MKKLFLRRMAGLCATALLAASAEGACTLVRDAGTIVLENDWLRAVFEPAKGGTCRELRVKATGVDYAGERHHEARLFADRFRTGGNCFNRVYEAEVTCQTPEAVEVRLRVQAPDGHPFLRIDKIVRLAADSDALSVRYVYTNLPEAMSETVIEPYFRLGWSAHGAREPAYFVPTASGVEALGPDGGDVTRTDLVDGWIACGGRDGTHALKCSFDYARTAAHYFWLGGANDTTSEWWFLPLAIPAGGTFETTLVLRPVDRPELPQGPIAPPSPKVKPAERQPFTLTLSDDVPSSGRRWADPSAAGVPRVLVVAALPNLREAVELRARVKMEVRAVRIDFTREMMAWGMAARYGAYSWEDMNDSLKAELARRPDVLVASGSLLEKADAANRATIARLLKEGMGLVAVGPEKYPDILSPALDIVSPEPGADALRAASGWAMSCGLPAAAPCVRAGRARLGNRTAIFDYPSAGGGLTPFVPYAAEDPGYPAEDYALGHLGRAVLWAAGLSSPCRIAHFALAADGTARVALAGHPAAAVRAVFTLRNTYDGTVREETASGGPDAGAWTQRWGALAPGLNIADIIVYDAEGRTLDWAHATRRVDSPAPITAFAAGFDGFAVTGRVQAAGGGIALALTDGYGRLHATGAPAADGAFRLVPLDNLTGTYTVEARVRTGAVLADRRRIACDAPRPSPRDPCLPFALGESAQHVRVRRYLLPLRFACYRAAGVNELRFWQNAPSGYFRLASAAGFGANFPVTGTHLWTFVKDYFEPYAQTKDRRYLCRRPCFDDADYLAAEEARIEAAVNRLKGHSPASFDAGDENSLTLWSMPFDFCFCPHTLTRFRTWLREEYGSLARLNAEWRTDFSGWDAVMPATTEEARAAFPRTQSYAPWSDHRRFMELSYCGFFARVRAAVRRAMPGAPLDMSGTQPPTGYTGMDMWLLADTIDVAAAYDRDNLAEIVRSFGRPLIKPWYGYGGTSPDIPYRVWFDAFRFRNYGVSFYDGMNVLDPDYTLPQATRVLAPPLADLRRGAGLLLRELEETPVVYVHYSQPSIRVAAIEKREPELLASRAAWCRLLDEAQLPFRFLAYGEIERGDLGRGGVRVLILPFSQALSDREVDEIEAFAARGGLVLGDAGCNRFNEHGTVRPQPGLRGLSADAPDRLPAGELRRRVTAVAGELPVAFPGLDGRGVRTFVYRHPDAPGDWYLGLVRAPSAPGAASETVTAVSRRPAFVYDIRASRLLADASGTTGGVTRIDVPLAKGEAVFLACLAAPLGSLAVSCTGVDLNGRWRFAIRQPGAAFNPVAVTVRGPGGRVREMYCGHTACRRGQAEWSFVPALNDPPGVYEVIVTDLLSGQRAVCREIQR